MFRINFVKIITIDKLVFCVTLDNLRYDVIMLGIIVYFRYHRIIRNYTKNKMTLKFWGRV
jgi:hypothetical protein